MEVSIQFSLVLFSWVVVWLSRGMTGSLFAGVVWVWWRCVDGRGAVEAPSVHRLVGQREDGLVHCPLHHHPGSELWRQLWVGVRHADAVGQGKHGELVRLVLEVRCVTSLSSLSHHRGLCFPGKCGSLSMSPTACRTHALQWMYASRHSSLRTSRHCWVRTRRLTASRRARWRLCLMKRCLAEFGGSFQ